MRILTKMRILTIKCEFWRNCEFWRINANLDKNLNFEEKWDILDDSIKDSKLDLFLFRLVFSCTRFWFHCYALLKYFFFVPQSISRFIPLDSWASFCQLFRSKSNRNWIENFHICFYKGRSSFNKTLKMPLDGVCHKSQNWNFYIFFVQKLVKTKGVLHYVL